LVDEIIRGYLRLLKRELEEAHHLLIVFGELHPAVDERAERPRVGLVDGNVVDAVLVSNAIPTVVRWLWTESSSYDKSTASTGSSVTALP
jgi:hypothetical protein